jgi:hypothetical protein
MHRTGEARVIRIEDAPQRPCMRTAIALATAGWVVLGGVIAAVMTLVG